MKRGNEKICGVQYPKSHVLYAKVKEERRPTEGRKRSTVRFTLFTLSVAYLHHRPLSSCRISYTYFSSRQITEMHNAHGIQSCLELCATYD